MHKRSMIELNVFLVFNKRIPISSHNHTLQILKHDTKINAHSSIKKDIY